MKKRKFEDWEYSQINKEFGYKRYYEGFSLLETWLQADEPITEREQIELQKLAKYLFYNVENWNESDLKFFFISNFIRLVNLYTEQYTIFMQRPLSAIMGEWEVRGMVDFVLSEGIQHPEQPFFFIQEYEQERKQDYDILGKLLIEMIVVQNKNELKIPIYGCYNIGRFHFFVVLNENDYAVSNALNATSADILQIFRMFRFVKRKIEEIVQA